MEHTMLAVAAVVLGITQVVLVGLVAVQMVLVEANPMPLQLLLTQAEVAAVVVLLVMMALDMVAVAVLELLLFDTLSLKGK
jgi:hypothetical protein